MAVIKTKYDQTKVCDTPLFSEFASVQELFSIKSIDDSGIFELNEKRYSKLYILSDINFAGVTDAEQKSIIINFSKVLKTIPCRFAFSVANEYVDEKEFNERIRYKLREDKYDVLRKAYNKVIIEKVSDAKQGHYQSIYLTLTIKAEDMQDARSSFMSMESAIRSAFIGIGVNGMQGSVMRTIGINERMQLIYNMTHAGISNGYKFDFTKELQAHHDWINILAPASICFENECFQMNDMYGMVMNIDEYPKNSISEAETRGSEA